MLPHCFHSKDLLGSELGLSAIGFAFKAVPADERPCWHGCRRKSYFNLVEEDRGLHRQIRGRFAAATQVSGL